MSPRPALPLRLEYVVLGLVRRQPVHGYELLHIWNQTGGMGVIWQVKTGSLYAALEKLERLGFLSAERTPGASAPQRKQYQVTSAGEQAFRVWLLTPVRSARYFRQDFLSRLAFLNEADPDEVTSLFQQQEAICRGWLASLTAQMESSQGYSRYVFSFRLKQVQAILHWLQEILPTFVIKSKER